MLLSLLNSHANVTGATVYVAKKFKFSIEHFDSTTGKCILENREELTYKCFRCKTIDTVDFNKVCNKG